MRFLSLIVTTAVLALSSLAADAIDTAGASARPARGACTFYASPHGTDSGRALRARQRAHRGRPGSVRNPYRSVHRVVSRLRRGLTGCLDSGTYATGSGLEFIHSGTSADPITLRSAPGARARLLGGIVYIPATSAHIVLADLSIDTRFAGQDGIQVMGSATALLHDHITNRFSRGSCVMLGSIAGWGQARWPVIRDSVIHDCGAPGDGNQDHAIYFENSLHGRIQSNFIYGASGFAIHLYPNAQYNEISHNVIDHNRYGVIFAGDGHFRSSHNLVIGNVISNTTRGYDVQSYWPGGAGTNNVLAGNCLYGGVGGVIAKPTSGFRSIANLIAPPDYRDAARHVYTLTARSRCLTTLAASATVQALRHWARLG